MQEELLPYYDRELGFLRQLGAEFAEKYPAVAARLLLQDGESEDPHVERLLQGFAFLAARIHRKLDDELPEVTDALLNVLYPHLLAPVPSMSIAQFVVEPEQAKQKTGYAIERGSALASPTVDGMPCRFRTCYPVTLWPLEVAAASVESPDRFPLAPSAASVIRLEMRCVGGAQLGELALSKLRFHLDGESSVTFPLYELLCSRCVGIEVRRLTDPDPAARIRLGPESLTPVGFADDEGMLPYGARSFPGYRLLQEYFSLPEKFLFVDVQGLEKVRGPALADGFQLLIYLDRTPRLEQPISASTFRLGCTPIVNLFSHVAEPIRLSHQQLEYRVMPDFRYQTGMEVYSVDTVKSTSPIPDEVVTIEPFYSLRHGQPDGSRAAYWYASRRPSQRKGDSGTDVFLSIVDLGFDPTLPAVETLTIHTTCSNRDLPAKLPFGGAQDRSDFELEGAAPVSRIRCLRKPTAAMRSRLRRGAQWKLISHLALNYLSVVEGGREALQEILRLYDFTDSLTVREQIDGIKKVSSRRVVARPSSLSWNGFCRGTEVEIEFDERKFVGSGVFLFACVLERFLGLYASINSFTRLVARTEQREEPLKTWPPRAGDQILV